MTYTSNDYSGDYSPSSRHRAPYNGRRYDDDTSFVGSILLSLPSLGTFALRAALGGTSVLYVLNQKHLLPRRLSGVVSKTLFWPTLPITASKRIGKWVSEIDDVSCGLVLVCS